ncbi:hypothetical protein vseg_021202 [Gypsophila vaccaria]
MDSSKVTQTPCKIEAEVPSKPVLDILANSGDNVPDIFTRESDNHHFATDPSAVPWTDCPVIDFSLLGSSSLGEKELRKLHSALVSWSCFQIINHGMTSTYLDEVREVSKGFCVQPIEERMKYMRGVSDPEGYGNDTILSQNVPHNWNDRLYLTVFPEDQRRLHLWPHTPSSFRKLLHEYTMKVHGVHKVLIQAMAKCLELEEDRLVQEYGEKMAIAARINYYPQCPNPGLIRASRMHSDASAITLLLPDKQVGGLQILKDDIWLQVPIIPHALVVNVGDQMEIMTNGIYKTSVHRVVANSTEERISLAMFCAPEPEKEIGPLKQLLTQNRPPLYKTVKRYSDIFFRYHPHGERPITKVTI